MLKKGLIIAALLAMFVPFNAGCSTTEPVIYSWHHNKRRLKSIANGFHELHMAIDRIFFDMEEYPIEAEY